LQFGTEQLACNQTHYKEEFHIHVDNETYTITSPLKGGSSKRGELNTYFTRNGKGITSHTHTEKGDGIDSKDWRKNGFRVNFKKRTANRSLYNWWDWDYNREEFFHAFVEHCQDHQLNPYYIAFPNTELQEAGGDKAGIVAMIDYIKRHGIPMSSIPEQMRKYLEGEKDVSLGY
jgi:hypothetical protein